MNADKTRLSTFVCICVHLRSSAALEEVAQTVSDVVLEGRQARGIGEVHVSGGGEVGANGSAAGAEGLPFRIDAVGAEDQHRLRHPVDRAAVQRSIQIR